MSPEFVSRWERLVREHEFMYLTLKDIVDAPTPVAADAVIRYARGLVAVIAADKEPVCD